MVATHKVKWHEGRRRESGLRGPSRISVRRKTVTFSASTRYGCHGKGVHWEGHLWRPWGQHCGDGEKADSREMEEVSCILLTSVRGKTSTFFFERDPDIVLQSQRETTTEYLYAKFLLMYFFEKKDVYQKLIQLLTYEKIRILIIHNFAKGLYRAFSHKKLSFYNHDGKWQSLVICFFF